jgi:hypothetical protein
VNIMNKCNNINFTTTCFSSLSGLYSIIMARYINDVLNETLKNMMRVPHREASKKVSVTQKFQPL